MTHTNGCSCLVTACNRGHFEIVKALIKTGWKELFVLSNQDGRTCLHVACLNGHVEIVNALIEASG
jgi:ankyrin repeat protein